MKCPRRRVIDAPVELRENANVLVQSTSEIRLWCPLVSLSVPGGGGMSRRKNRSLGALGMLRRSDIRVQRVQMTP